MTYLFIFITHLFILLLVPHDCFNCILCIVLLSLNKIVFYVYIWTFVSEINIIYINTETAQIGLQFVTLASDFGC